MVGSAEPLLERLKALGLQLEKETHPGKEFRAHVKECRKLASWLVDHYYAGDGELKRFVVALCCLHDVGKLLAKWSLNASGRPYHAIEGAEWLLRKRGELGIELPHEDVLIYAIITHHSMLQSGLDTLDFINESRRNRIRSFDSYRECDRFIRRMNLRGLSKELAVRLVDAMGMFKLADIVSAMGLNPTELMKQYSRAEGLEKHVINEIKRKAEEKVGGLDCRKFDLQLEMAATRKRYTFLAAPTGWGKTALALLRAVKLQPPHHKVFYVLPTITAIKEFYETLGLALGRDYVGEYFYFADVELLRRGLLEESVHPLDIYRYFIPKVTVTTADQVILTMLQVGRYHIRRFNFNNALLVFDEYHLLTPKMLAALKVFLKMFAKIYNFSLLFMSATPSPLYVHELRESLPETELDVLTLKDEYEKLRRHRVELEDRTVEQLVCERSDLLFSSPRRRRVLIIVNRVEEVQRVYKTVRQVVGTRREVGLLHSKYAYKDRDEKEKRIDGVDILVASQVAEVSLDKTFDLLITELAPIPSLIQRFGRVNRYGGVPDETNVYICKEEEEEPYLSSEMKSAHEAVGILREGLERKGEAIYLDLDWKFEELLKPDILNTESCLDQRLEIIGLHSIITREEEVSELLGREESWLAIPEIYRCKVKQLLDRVRQLKDHDERRRVFAEMKSYFMPISRWDLRSARWDEELKAYVTGPYDVELGLLRPK